MKWSEFVRLVDCPKLSDMNKRVGPDSRTVGLGHQPYYSWQEEFFLHKEYEVINDYEKYYTRNYEMFGEVNEVSISCRYDKWSVFIGNAVPPIMTFSWIVDIFF